VKIGTLRLFAVSLTIVGSTGFGRDGFLAGDRASREADLLSISDPDTYDEILRHALEVQPLPSAKDDDEPKDAGDDEDPSETSRTHPTPTDDVDPESPTA
jgi:hypothetical protein